MRVHGFTFPYFVSFGSERNLIIMCPSLLGLSPLHSVSTWLDILSMCVEGHIPVWLPGSFNFIFRKFSSERKLTCFVTVKQCELFRSSVTFMIEWALPIKTQVINHCRFNYCVNCKRESVLSIKTPPIGHRGFNYYAILFTRSWKGPKFHNVHGVFVRNQYSPLDQKKVSCYPVRNLLCWTTPAYLLILSTHGNGTTNDRGILKPDVAENQGTSHVRLSSCLTGWTHALTALPYLLLPLSKPSVIFCSPFWLVIQAHHAAR